MLRDLLFWVVICGWCDFVGVVILLRLRLFYVVAICWDFWVFAWCGRVVLICFRLMVWVG